LGSRSLVGRELEARSGLHNGAWKIRLFRCGVAGDATENVALGSSGKTKVFLLLFLQKKKKCSFSEEKEPKRLLFLAARAWGVQV
jgi:hypothetical protein